MNLWSAEQHGDEWAVRSTSDGDLICLCTSQQRAQQICSMFAAVKTASQMIMDSDIALHDWVEYTQERGDWSHLEDEADRIDDLLDRMGKILHSAMSP